MSIFLFIVMIFVVSIMRGIPSSISNQAVKEKNVVGMILALMIATGFLFIYPLILNMFLLYLFNFELNYWIAFAALIVLEVFTYTNALNPRSEE